MSQKSRLGHSAATPWFFLAPNLCGFLLFTFLPLIASLLIAFCSWDLFRAPRWVGFENFGGLIGFKTKLHVPVSGSLWLTGLLGWALLATIAGWMSRHHRRLALTFCVVGFLGVVGIFLLRFEPINPRFWQFMGNTFYLLIGLPISMACSLGLALLLNQALPAQRLFRLAVFLPSIVSGVGIYLLWKWIFNADYGLLNTVIRMVSGQDGPDWLQTAAWAKNAIIIMTVWSTAGGANMILYLAALQNVDSQLHEAAKIDGAGKWQRFIHITWPMISPTTAFILIMGLIAGFQGGFDAVYVMTQGGPAGSTTTLSYFIYENAFRNFTMGRAAAASWILAALVFVMTWINWKWISGKIHY